MKSIPINSSSQVLVLGSVNPIYVPSGSISVALFRFDKFKNPERHKLFASYRPQSSLTNFPRKSRLNSPFGGLLLRKRIKDSAGFLQKWISYVKGFGQPERSPEGWEGEYLQSGGIGMALMTMTSTAKLRVRPFVATLAANPTFVSGLLAWLMAQSTKVFLNFLVERKWDFRIFCASGGMPSSHSALCTALTTSVGLCHGVGDSLFPVCLGFSLVVMYDAVGVRRHAGMQAEVLNMIVDDLFKGHPISQRKLKVLLGHTPLQVLAGVLIGMLVAYLCCQGSFVGS